MKDSTSFSIFEKGQDGNYTRLALLYQDILKYSVLVKEGSPFKDRELANWLLYHNQYYINYYKDPSTKKTNEKNRVEYILDSTKDKLNDLIRLGLLESGTVPAEKGLGYVRVCKCTSDGRLLECIIESVVPSKRQKAVDDAYNIFQMIFNIEPRSSLEIFHSKLYKKYKDMGLFGEFVIDRLRKSFESVLEARSMRELQYASLVTFHTNDAEKNMRCFSLWDWESADLRQQATDIQQLIGCSSSPSLLPLPMS